MGEVTEPTCPRSSAHPQPGELKILNQTLKDALADVERLRSERTPGGTPFHPTPGP